MITEKVLAAFNISGEGKPLEGGQGEAVKYGDIVLKPAGEREYYNFTAKIWKSLKPEGYRISKPVVSKNGRFIEGGYAATYYEQGKEYRERVKEKIEVSRLLHRDLRKLNIKTLPHSDDPWTRANNIIWGGEKLPDGLKGSSRNLYRELINSLEDVEVECQLIHGDLAGNILFSDELEPLVIDFSPAVAPERYAEAIIVCDSIAWQGADISTLELLEPFDDYIPFVQRAVAFRVVVMALLEEAGCGNLDKEWQAYKNIWEAVTKKTSYNF